MPKPMGGRSLRSGDHRRQIDAVEQWLMRDLGTGKATSVGINPK